MKSKKYPYRLFHLPRFFQAHNEPHEILNATRKIIIERLKKDGSEEGGKDGMDCSLCVYDFGNMKLFIAAAHNPVWIMRQKKVVNLSASNAATSSEVEKSTAVLDSARPDNKILTHDSLVTSSASNSVTSSEVEKSTAVLDSARPDNKILTHDSLGTSSASNSVTSSEVEKSTAVLDSARPDIEVIEIKPDKMPVDKHDKQDNPFTLQTIDIQKGDVIYTLTDGFPDQFGGEKGKKFMSKNLRTLLSQNSHLNMTEQKIILEKTFSEWVGKLEQVDDVCVVGVKV